MLIQLLKNSDLSPCPEGIVGPSPDDLRGFLSQENKSKLGLEKPVKS